ALAASLGLSAPHLRRMLLGLAALGLVETHDNSFVLTDLGRALAPDSSTNLREKLLIVVEQYWQPWANLAGCAATGEPAFDEVFGTAVGDWRQTNPAHGQAFNAYLARESFTNAEPVIDALALAGTETIADIGGGYGGLLAALLTRHPTSKGILFDQPYVIANAKPYLEAAGVAGEVSLVPGDFVEAIHVEADIYVLKDVLQQHDDAEAQKILENCCEAMKPGTCLIVYERLMPETAMDDPVAIMLDLHMMAITGGKARTKSEIEALIAKAGLDIVENRRTCEGLALIDIRRPELEPQP
ncbi:MAG: methyltransferase, partial [Alphaproteobacteria bacterium]